MIQGFPCLEPYQQNGVNLHHLAQQDFRLLLQEIDSWYKIDRSIVKLKTAEHRSTYTRFPSSLFHPLSRRNFAIRFEL
jgi:hypothetical protein